ncbi:hypothetical protein [Draconibacterium halophilum]|uniref:Uncharacterized protein n=1 Tax=Draconibacterium halophilum TaxID=2706887 RepID=A0A6C0REK0_9BACT|nr:hypothetical protein [Draconibacterium halophilum]QIA07481.1 hypothetical protein G0Q07_06980 [Draconibacterium halophilum]
MELLFVLKVIRMFGLWLRQVYKTQMGTILLQIAPIHFQATEVTFGARLRLLRPASAFSFESAFALTFRFGFLRLNLPVVLLVIALTFLNEVSVSVFG